MERLRVQQMGEVGIRIILMTPCDSLFVKNGQPIPTLEEVMPLLLKVENIYLEIKESDVFGALLADLT